VKTPPTAAPKPTFTHELANSDKSMPLGVSDMTPEDVVLDPLAGAGESRRFKAGSVIIVVVVVIACAGLWFMRTMSHVSIAAAAKSTDAEQDIEKFLGQRDAKGNPKGGNNASVLQVLSSSYTDQQVPLESVKANPFILPGEGGPKMSAPVYVPTDNSEMAMARARESRQKDFTDALERLVLKSVIMSSQPLANISGQIVRQGDEISPENSDVTFRVERINNDEVTLVASDVALGLNVELTLAMRRDK
jgi:hypothetical protein